MPLPDLLQRLLRGRAEHLHWALVPADHVMAANGRDPLPVEPDFVAGEDYVVIRLAEMFLRETRRLWREQHGMVHAYVTTGDPKQPTQHTAIAGPGQLKELGNQGLDRLVSLAHRLAGPVVHDGQDIELLVGLYAVPGRNHAKVVVEMLSAVAALASPAASEGLALADAVRKGVEGVLGLDGTSLRLGVHETLRAPNAAGSGAAGTPLRPCFLAGIALPQHALDPEMLWVRGGTLRHGPSPVANDPFDAADYMLIEVARGPSRALSWPVLAGLDGFGAEFDAALAEAGDAATKKDRLRAVWPRFQAAVLACPELTGKPDGSTGDRQKVLGLMAETLKSRIAAIEGAQPWETRGAGGQVRRLDPARFSMRDIDEADDAPFWPPGQSLFA
jgi:hypothetical protein